MLAADWPLRFPVVQVLAEYHVINRDVISQSKLSSHDFAQFVVFFVFFKLYVLPVTSCSAKPFFHTVLG